MDSGFKTVTAASKAAYFNKLWDDAHVAGMIAAGAMTPTPMIVEQHANMLDDASPVVKSWTVLDGACGFAWVIVKPGNSPFANWAKKYKGAKKDYYGGVRVKWVSEFNQSIARKEAYAGAFAKVLSDAGIKAYANSRLD